MRRREKLVCGWREWVALPAFGVERIKAKIDTGARTSAIHAFRIKAFDRDGQAFVRFTLHPVQRRRHPSVPCEAPLADTRVVTSSSGQRERRYVIVTPLRLGDREWPIEITLTDRDQMGFRMLLGRQALRSRLVVDPGSSFRFGGDERSRRKGNKP